ncbi:MAG: hypothetical protein IT337_10570 [Thermomicrobiales bacterium]|nr:hypothetical protein [Thermomicrobiales bacterium]
MERRARTAAEPKLPGIFETIALAFSALLVAPVPALFPLIVDAWLWKGPRLSPAALTSPLTAALSDQPGVDPTMVEALTRWGQTGDLTAIVGWFVPSLLTGADRVAMGMTFTDRPAVVLSAGGAVAAGVLLVALAVLLTMAFKTLLGRIALGAPLLDANLGRDVLRNFARYLGFLGLAAAAVLGIAVPAGVLLAILQMAGIDLLPLFGLVVSMAVFVAAFLLAFVAEAIVVAGVGPIRAMRLSARVVQRFPWRTIGLLLTLWVALFSLPPLLAMVARGPVGIVIAIVFYAFAATGLSLARFVFFADRLPRAA